jgi:hypothetical protein
VAKPVNFRQQKRQKEAARKERQAQRLNRRGEKSPEEAAAAEAAAAEAAAADAPAADAPASTAEKLVGTPS